MRSESSPIDPPGPEPAPPARRLATLLVLLCVAGALWLVRRLAAFEYGLDQGIYATVADVMLDGGAPYRDAWDFKPPGIFLVYAFAKGVFGDSMQAVRALEALLLVSLFPAFALYTRRFAGSVWPGLLGASFAISGHVWMGFWHTAQPETFGAVLLAWALVLATVPDASPRRPLADAGAAALYACAALLKPPLGGGILVSFAFAVRRSGSFGGPALAYAIGGALPVAVTLLYFAAHGALGDLHEALFVFAPEYTALNYRAGDLPGFLWRSVELLFLRFSWLNGIGLVLWIALPKRTPRAWEGGLHVLGVLAFCVLGVALQGRFFAYHYGAAVPLLALLAGWGWFGLTRVQERHAVGAVLLAVALGWLANANGVTGRVPGGFLERVTRVDPGIAYNAPLRRAAAWLRANTAPDDRIHVFGFQPALYDLANRRPASRFVYNAPQRAPWYRERGRDALMRDLEASRPEVILVERGDVHPGTAGTALDSEATLARFARLDALLRRDYDAVEEIAPFTIHRRREAPRLR